MTEKEFKTDAGIKINRVYNPDNCGAINYRKDVGDPGEYPFVRGIFPNMYRQRLWMVRQYVGFGLPEDTNRRAREMFKEGSAVDDLAVVNIMSDTVTRFGYDSDHPPAKDEVGKTGVALDNLEDMEIIYDGFDLRKTFSLLIGVHENAPILALYIALAENHGVSPRELRGGLLNDPLRLWNQQMAIFPLVPALRLCLDCVEFCAHNAPHITPIAIAPSDYRESGATAVQATAFCLANAMAYIQSGIARGLTVDDIAPGLSFYFQVGNHFFESISQLRAFRRMWARTTREKFGAKDPRSWRARIVARTEGTELSTQQPLTNVIRGAIGGLAGVFGGVQALTITPYDEPICLPTEEAMTLALRTHQILAEENGVIDTVDPLAGSYYVESLTNEFERQVQTYLDHIEKLGEDRKYGEKMLSGVITGIQSGYFNKEVVDSAYKRKKAIESGEKVIVGLNKYLENKETPITLFKADPEVRRIKVERLAKFRAQRDNGVLQQALDEVRIAAKGSANMLPSLVNAFRKKATIGEVTAVLKESFGSFSSAPFKDDANTI